MKLRLSLLSVLLTGLVITGCNRTAGGDAAAVILETGSARLTRNEWNKQAKNYAVNYRRRHYSAPPADSVKNQAAQFVDYSYVLAAAYARGYDHDPQVNARVLATSKFMMCQKYGDLYQTIIVPKIKITDADIKEAIVKSKRIILFSVLKFASKAAMTALLGTDTLPGNEAGFLKAVKKCVNHKNEVSFIKARMNFPSPQFPALQDKIWQMADRSVSAPVYADGDPYDSAVYIIFKESTASTPGIPPADQQKLKAAMQAIAEDRLYTSYIQRLIRKAAISIDSALLKTLMQKVKYGSRMKLDGSSVAGLLNRKLFSYNDKNSIRTFSVAGFLKSFNNSPIRQQLKTIADYQNFIKGIVVDDLAYNDAVRLELHKRPRFLSDQLNFRNRSIADAFKAEVLFKNINLTDSALRTAYSADRQSFRAPAAVEGSIFKFNDLAAAYYTSQLIKQLVPGADINTTLIKGLKSYSPNVKIGFADTSYGRQILNQLFRIPDHATTRPSLLNNQVVIIRRERSLGVRLQPYEEVKEQISAALLSKRENLIMARFLAAAKRRYSIKNSFAEEDYVTKPE